MFANAIAKNPVKRTEIPNRKYEATDVTNNETFGYSTFQPMPLSSSGKVENEIKSPISQPKNNETAIAR
jgi:hypothetical protein